MGDGHLVGGSGNNDVGGKRGRVNKVFHPCYIMGNSNTALKEN